VVEITKEEEIQFEKKMCKCSEDGQTVGIDAKGNVYCCRCGGIIDVDIN